MDRIETATHQALFIKSLREDGRGAGTDAAGAGTNVDLSFSEEYTNILGPEAIPGCPVTHVDADYSVTYDNMSERHQLLKLDKVILTQKADLVYNKVGSTKLLPTGQGEFTYQEDKTIDYFDAVSGNTCSPTTTITDLREITIDRYLSDNVLDIMIIQQMT